MKFIFPASWWDLYLKLVFKNGGFSFDISQEGDYSLYITKDGYIDRFSDISTIPNDEDGLINNEIITKNFELEKR